MDCVDSFLTPFCTGKSPHQSKPSCMHFSWLQANFVQGCGLLQQSTSSRRLWQFFEPPKCEVRGCWILYCPWCQNRHKEGYGGLCHDNSIKSWSGALRHCCVLQQPSLFFFKPFSSNKGWSNLMSKWLKILSRDSVLFDGPDEKCKMTTACIQGTESDCSRRDRT